MPGDGSLKPRVTGRRAPPVSWESRGSFQPSTPATRMLPQRWAAVLMEPQFAVQVSTAFAKKIEAIAKQPAWWARGVVSAWLSLRGNPGKGSGVWQPSARRAVHA